MPAPPAGQDTAPAGQDTAPVDGDPPPADKNTEGEPLDLQVAATIQGHSAAIRSIAFSPDGNRIVTGSEDTSIRVWDAYRLSVSDDASRLDELLNLSGHTRSVNGVRFTADGQDVISASGDGFAILWHGDPVAPAIRLSDQATSYEAGGVRVDPELVVMEPTIMKRSDSDYRVVVSIEAETDAGDSKLETGGSKLETGGSKPWATRDAGERLTLELEPGVVEFLSDEAAKTQTVLCFDRASNSMLDVAVLTREDGKLVFQLTDRANNRSLQTVLRHVKYTMYATDAELTRVIRFNLIAQSDDGEEKPSIEDSKLINITATGASSVGSGARVGEAGIHHIGPAGLLEVKN